MTDRSMLKAWGFFCLFCFVVHGTYCVAFSHPAQLCWVCHLAAAAVGVGLIRNMPVLVGGGAICLFVGTPLWAMDVLLGAELSPTSILTHVGGFLTAAITLPQVGIVPGLWWKTTLAVASLQQLCRWSTPPELNINAAYEIYPRAAPYFQNYPLYLMATLFSAIAIFATMECLLRRMARQPGTTSAQSE